MTTPRLEFRILGPLSVRVDGTPVPIGGPKQRALLALLLLDANRVVPRQRLIEELFADQSVNSADHALRNHVHRLRKVLAPASAQARLVARAPGYLIRVEPGELDLERFEMLVAQAREALASDGAAAAAASLRTAEGLWEGRPLADLEFDPYVRVEVERLEELRLAAVEERIDAELVLGRHRVLVAELEALAAEHPYRERYRAQLMLALYRCGRQADALAVYRRTRGKLNDELGLAPGTELQELQRAILVQDDSLALEVATRREPAPDLRDVCPFRGLAPFTHGDAEFFFGRRRLVGELVARLRDSPLLVLVGASGSGKSSLLQAGLLPALGRSHVVVRPGQSLPLPGATEILAVDQLEELFGPEIDEEARVVFVDALVDLAWDPEPRTILLLALRADFFGHLARYPELADLAAANHVLLGPLSVSELRSAIEGPAERTGLQVEPALVDVLVDAVSGEPGALPLLQETMLDVWGKRDQRTLTLASYEETGGVRGAVGRRAEATYRALEVDERSLARRILLRLVAGGEGEALVRRRATRAELDADDERVGRVVAAFVERRLLVADNGTVELVHEALLEHWPRLRAWVEEDAQGRRLHQHLAGAAAAWEDSGREAGELYRGARLSAALEWDAESEDAGLNRPERAFLEASRTAFARTNRRLRALLAAAVLLLAVALVAGGAALSARSAARRDATTATAERLGAQALVEPRIDRALLLAREGVNLDDSLATRSNLLSALLRAPAAIGVARPGSDRLLDEAISPDGRTLAVRGDSGDVVFFDAATLKRTGRKLTGSDQLGLNGATVGPLRALAFSPDGKTIAVGSTAGNRATLDLVDARTGAPRATASDGAFHTADVAFSRDGRFVATGEPVNGTTHPPDAVVVVHDTRNGHVLATSAALPGGRLAGYGVDSTHLLVTEGPNRSVLLDARTLELQRTLALGGVAALSRSGTRAVFGHADGSLTLLDLQTMRTRPLPGRASGAIEVACFSPDGSMLATGGTDGAITLWDTTTGQVRESLQEHTAAVRGAVFSPDGRTLYTASLDGSVMAWDVSGRSRLGQAFRFTTHLGTISTWSETSPTGSLFALSPGRDEVTLWRLPTRRLPGALRGPVGDVNGLAFSPSGTLVAAAGSRHAVVWDVRTRRVLWVVPAGEHGAAGIAFSPDGRTFAVGGLNGEAIVYSLRTGARIVAFEGKGSIPDIDFSPDGKLLASASLTGTVTLWDIAGRHQAADLRSAILLAAVRFSPDGKLIAVGDSSGNVVLWDAVQQTRVGEPLSAGAGIVTSLDFDPSGTALVTASADGQFRLWDVTTRKLIGAPLPASPGVVSASFFPDGKHVVGVSGTGTGVVWNVAPAAWRARACLVANRNLTPDEWRRFLPERSYRTVCP